MNDEPIMATNNDATECKRGAVQLGYWQDDYLPLFVKQIQRKAPEINRGYYARVKGIESYIRRFIDKFGETSQIINLGSGFDTLFWRLKDENKRLANFIDVDFPSVTAKKCYIIKRNKKLLEKIYEQDGEVKLSSTDLHTGTYHCIGVDLRNTSELESKLGQSEVNYLSPTLFIAECVLVYIENECVNRLLSWVASKFTTALFVNYEMCNINDTFGDVMLGNFKARGCTLAGVVACQNLESQRNRFLNNNWHGANVRDMVEIYYSLPQYERQRIEKIEFLDEQELLIQLFQHYCICVGWLGSDLESLSATLESV